MTPRTAAAVLSLALLLGLRTAAEAGDLVLRLQDGKVYLVAHDVPVRQILAEWARVGPTLVTNADKLMGPPLTLELQWVPERTALDSILRSATGYMAATRAPGFPGTSVFDRILIMATSGVPPPQAVAPPALPQTFVAPAPGVQPATEMDDTEQDQGSEDPADFINPATPDAFPQPFNPRANPGSPFGPGTTPYPGATYQPPTNVNIPALAQPPTANPTPTNPWGIQGGSNVPGVINQPQQPTEGQPGQERPPLNE